MNQPFLFFAAATLLAVSVAGCQSTGGIEGRSQEKSAVYATLKPWEKKYIEKGSVAVGFTPDMVYIALGHPTHVDSKSFPEGPAELWTYARAYPKAGAIRGFKHVIFTVDSAYQSTPTENQVKMVKVANVTNTPGEKSLAGPDHSGNDSIHKTGSPQGGAPEPADVPSYTLYVLFEGGEVARLAAVPNPN